MINKIVIAMLMVCSFAIGCKDSKNVITADQFEKATTNGQIQLVDVRTEGEFNSEHIETAVNYDINGGEFETQIKNLDKTKPVYVYCLSGSRSRTAGKILNEAGFLEVYELGGGILAWTKTGKPVVATKPKVEVLSGNQVEMMVAESIANDTLTMIDFFAYWCKPCMQMKPAIDKLEKELVNDVEILSVNVDEQQALSMKYGISAMPTLVFFKNNDEVHRVVGFQTEDQLRNVINKFK